MSCGRSPSIVRNLQLERGRRSTRVSWTEPVECGTVQRYNMSVYFEMEGRVDWYLNTTDELE